VLIACEDDPRDDEGCKDGDVSASADSNHIAFLSDAPTAAAQPNLTPSEMRDRARSFVSRHNRRFGGLQPK
jgi:hypothetical protein